MKLSKDELKQKIDEVVENDDVKISLLEDVEDSFEVKEDIETVDKNAYDEVVAKYEEIKEKYKERFLGKEDGLEEKEDEKEDDIEEMTEEEVIDIKEI